MGPSINGPTGWTAATLSPKLTNLPVSQNAAARFAGWGKTTSQRASGLPAPVSGGGASSDLSKYDLKQSDYGGSLVQSPQTSQTPLESLLAAIYPDLAAGDSSAFQNVLAGLGQRGASNGFVTGGPSLSGPQVGPSLGANLAATIPGAPPSLANAINGVNTFNPYAQRPAAPAAVGGGFDPLIGLSQISAEQRIQQAQLDADKAKAQAKWHASTLEQERMRAEKANLDSFRGGWSSPAGFGAPPTNGWTPPVQGANGLWY